MFQMPNAVTITGRSSSITNSFVNSIIPIFHPSEEEVDEALAVLGMSADSVECVYCGGKTSEWDHFRPLVRDKRPTGYVSEIANLVPACGKCNQSKGASDWRSWMLGSAKLCPASRGIPDLQERVSRLEEFERWREPRVVDFEHLAGGTLWEKHWDNHRRLTDLMAECQNTADDIEQRVRSEFDVRPPQRARAGHRSARSVANREGRAGGDVERLLRSVGYATFVEHYSLFADETLSNEEVIRRLPHGWDENGRRTRVTCARRIIKGGMAREALQAVAGAAKVASTTVEQAKRLLWELGSS